MKNPWILIGINVIIVVPLCIWAYFYFIHGYPTRLSNAQSVAQTFIRENAPYKEMTIESVKREFDNNEGQKNGYFAVVTFKEEPNREYFFTVKGDEVTAISYMKQVKMTE